MKYQDFEKGLKRQFQNASEHVDTEALILNLHKAKRKKRRLIILWLFSCICVITLGYTAITNLSAVKVEHYAENNSFAIPEDKSSEAELPDRESTETSILTSGVNNDLSLEQRKREPEENNRPKPILTREDNIPTANSNSLIEQLTGKKSNYTRATSIKNLDHIGNPVKNMKDIKVNPPLWSKPFVPNNISLPLIDPLPIDTLNLLNKQDINPDIDTYFLVKKQRWALDLIPEIGIIRPLKSLSNKGLENSSTFSARLDDETTLEAIQAGLYLRARIVQNPIYFKIGSSFTRISERLNLDVNWAVRDTSIGITSITKSLSGDTISTISGEIITETEHYRVSRDHYYLFLIDLPISFGYNKSLRNGWRLGGEAGIQLNLSIQSFGRLLENYKQNSFTELPAEGRFRKNLGMSYFGGLMLEKTITPRASFYISPRVRFFEKSFSVKTYKIDQNYFFAGIHTGLVYNIK